MGSAISMSWMTAEQAHWLGRIDEVLGRAGLPCPRHLVEYPQAGKGDLLNEPMPGRRANLDNVSSRLNYHLNNCAHCPAERTAVASEFGSKMAT